MLNPIKNGSIELVYPEPESNPIACHIPPVGYGVDSEGKLVHIGVYRRHKTFENCKWERDPRWKEYLKWKDEEDKMRKTNKDYHHPDLTKFVNDCWQYRECGFWFYKKDKPTYINGDFWFYLSVITMESGQYPKYRDSDRHYFYFWQFCEEHPNCLGMLYITMRRDGKSFKAGSIGLNRATQTEHFNVGIQSKNEDDAEELFSKAIIQPYRKFPYFFEVAKSNIKANGKVPKNELLFSSNKSSEIDEELASKIDFRSSGNFAYDGSKVNYFISDEIGKPQAAGADINKRLGVVELCMKDFEHKIIGKTMHTSTVEDNSGASENLKIMWDGSDCHKVISEGKSRTETGLFRYFKAAQDVLVVDEYGDVDVLKGLEKIMADREVLKDKPRKLHELKTKVPTSVKEAFMTSTEKCVFSATKIEGRDTELTWHVGEPLYTRGKFGWVSEEWGEVKFIPDLDGDVYLIEDVPEEIRNRHIYRSGFKAPANSHIYSMGVDTYDHKIIITKNNEKDLSDGSFSIVKKPTDVHSSSMDNGLICYFRARYEDPNRFYKQAIMAMLYFGAEALIERNKPGLLNYMKQVDLELYATLLPGQTQRGVHATDTTNNNIFELTDQYINDYIKLINILDLIGDWKKFDPSDTTKYDGAMGFGYALMQWDMRKPKMTRKKEDEVKDITQLFSFYKR